MSYAVSRAGNSCDYPPNLGRFSSWRVIFITNFARVWSDWRESKRDYKIAVLLGSS